MYGTVRDKQFGVRYDGDSVISDRRSDFGNITRQRGCQGLCKWLICEDPLQGAAGAERISHEYEK
jgi:hypothetical protein